VPATSFCYPYTQVSPHLEQAVVKYYRQARGGRGAREYKCILPGDGFNRYNVPCHHINGGVI
jgi:hypothetical protein